MLVLTFRIYLQVSTPRVVIDELLLRGIFSKVVATSAWENSCILCNEIKLRKIRKQRHTQRRALQWAAHWASKSPKLYLLSPCLAAKFPLFSLLLNTNHPTMPSPRRCTFFLTICNHFSPSYWFFSVILDICMNFTAPYVQYQTLACITKKPLHEFCLKKSTLAIQIGALLATVRQIINLLYVSHTCFSWAKLLW